MSRDGIGVIESITSGLALGAQGSVDGFGSIGQGLGNDPAEDDFGAKRVQAESTDRGWLADIDNHLHYYDKNTESLHNVAAIATARYEQADSADHRRDPWYAETEDPEGDREPREIRHRR